MTQQPLLSKAGFQIPGFLTSLLPVILSHVEQAAAIVPPPGPALQVKCCECGYESNTMEGFLDISLDITRASSLTKALARHTAAEYLDQENKYKCPKQGRLVRAVKRITIERAPNVLVFQLKRFEYSMFGSKIAKKVRDIKTTAHARIFVLACTLATLSLHDIFRLCPKGGNVSLVDANLFVSCIVLGTSGKPAVDSIGHLLGSHQANVAIANLVCRWSSTLSWTWRHT
jgi:hypothetical protein